MNEKTFIISKINEAANAILESLTIYDRTNRGCDINGIIIAAMDGKYYITHNERNEVTNEWISVFSFVKFKFRFDIDDEKELKKASVIYTKALEIDRLIQMYRAL